MPEETVISTEPCSVPRMLNVAEVAPLGMVTVDGMLTFEDGLALRLSTAPPGGAGTVTVTVPVVETPIPITGDVEDKVI